MTKRAVFLDRDGVINRTVVRNNRPYPPSSVEELEILPRVAEALHLLRKEGFQLIVATNQPDVARGTKTKEEVEAIHTALLKELPLDDILVCYHDDSDRCHCRKPKAGLLLDAAKTHKIDLSSSFMVGDRWKDIEAGQKAGCKTIFIDYAYDEKQPVNANIKVKSLKEAVNWICF